MHQAAAGMPLALVVGSGPPGPSPFSFWLAPDGDVRSAHLQSSYWTGVAANNCAAIWWLFMA